MMDGVHDGWCVCDGMMVCRMGGVYLPGAVSQARAGLEAECGMVHQFATEKQIKEKNKSK